MCKIDSNRFNSIFLLDSIPDGEMNTAKRLHDEIDTYASAHSPSPTVQYRRAVNRVQFFDSIGSLYEPAKSNADYPLIHIECHGNEHGFQLADGSLVDWPEMKQLFTELNVITQLNLMVVVAACTGGAFAKITRIADRAPFWGMIGPTDTVTPGELEKGYGAFYRALLKTKNAADAINALDAQSSDGLFWRTTAQGLFAKAWARYQEQYCTPESLDQRAVRMQETLQRGGHLKVLSKSEALERLRWHEPQSFKRFQDTFFMRDLYPSHVGRFDIEYVSQW